MEKLFLAHFFMPDLPTVDFKGIEVFASGTFNGDLYSDADLDIMVDAFDKVGFKPTVKAGHADGQENEKKAREVFGAPALGYVSRIYRNGNKLLADLTKVPRKFADLIKAGSYSRVSSEIYWNLMNEGKKIPRALKSIAFLGADIPALTNLKEIEALYQKNDAGQLVAYDENKNEFRPYDLDVSEPAPMLERYRDDGEVRIYKITKRGDEFCVTTEDGSKTLGCHDSKEKAMAQLRAVEANKNNSRDENVIGIYQMKIVKEGDEFCVKGDDGETVKKYPTRKEAEDYMASMMDKEKYEQKRPDARQYNKGGHQMTHEEFEEEMKQHTEKLKAELTKEYEYRIHKAREDGKAEAEKDSDQLREEIRKLQSEKRSERIESWLKRMKAEGKMAPVEESKVRALREWIPDEAETIKHFSQAGGKTKEHADTPADVFESLFESRPSMFKILSKSGDEDSFENEGEELADAGAEVDRRAKVYISRQAQQQKTVTYSDALKYVLKQDIALAQKYQNSSH